MKTILFSFIFMIYLLCGCGVEGKAGKCELHDKRLHKSLVRVKYGAYCAPGTHLGKGSENFPNAKHPICGGCTVGERFRWMYNCSKCNKARIKHIATSFKEHSGEKEIRAKF